MKVSVPVKSVTGEYVIVEPSVVAVPPLFGVPTLEIVSISPSSGKVESFGSTSSELLVVSSVTESESEFAVGTLLSCKASLVTPVNVEDVGPGRDDVVFWSGNVNTDPVIELVDGPGNDDMVFWAGNVNTDPVIELVDDPGWDDVTGVIMEPVGTKT